MHMDNALTRLSLLERLGAPDKDDDAWQEFVDLYVQLIVGWCRHWGVPETDMEEVVQETVFQVVKGLGGFRYLGQGSFRGWLQTIAQRCWSRVSKCRTRALSPGEGKLRKGRPVGVIDPASDPHDHLMKLFDEWATREIVELAMLRTRRRVKRDVWEVYDLAIRQRLGSQATAARLEIPVKLVYSRVLEFRRILKEEMAILDPPERSEEETQP